MFKFFKKNDGLSFIEVILVVSILAVLIWIAFGFFDNPVEKAKTNVEKINKKIFASNDFLIEENNVEDIDNSDSTDTENEISSEDYDGTVMGVEDGYTLYASGSYTDEIHSISREGFIYWKQDMALDNIQQDSNLNAYARNVGLIYYFDNNEKYIDSSQRESFSIASKDFALTPDNNIIFLTTENKLYHYDIKNNQQTFLRDANLTKIYVDSKGNIFGTNNVYSSGYLYKYDKDGNFLWSKKNSIDYDTYASFGKLVIDKNNNIYLTTSRSSVYYIDGENGEIIKEFTLPNENGSYISFYDIKVDLNNDLYLVLRNSQTTGDYGLRKYTDEGELVWSFLPLNDSEDVIPVKGVDIDPYGNIYVAAKDYLYLLNSEGEEIWNRKAYPDYDTISAYPSLGTYPELWEEGGYAPIKDLSVDPSLTVNDNDYVDTNNDSLYINSEINNQEINDCTNVNEISNASELSAIRNDLSGCYKLTNDIDLNVEPFNQNKGWKPIGYDDLNMFTGILDGNGYKIKNLFAQKGGLFYGLGENGVIKNIGITNSYIVAENAPIGILVNENKNGIIDNVYVTGRIEAESFDYVGGIAGRNYNKVQNSYSSVTIDGFEYVGGLIGSSLGNIINSYSDSVVSGTVRVGGLIGSGNKEIRQSIAKGKVLLRNGLHGSSGYMGGLAGSMSYGEIHNSYSNVYIEPGYTTGGLLGVQRGTDVYNSYAVPDFDTYKGRNGGLVGYEMHDSITEGSYFDKEVYGGISSASGDLLTTNEMKTAQTFIDAGWDDNIWHLEDGQYPELKMMK